MVSPALAVPYVWVSAGGVEVAVVGRVVDGQARHAAVGGAVAAGRICAWWAALGAGSGVGHRGFTVPRCGSVITRAVPGRSPGTADARKRGSSSTSPVSADHRRPLLTAAYSTVAGTVYARPGRPYPETAIYLGKYHGRGFT